MRQRESIVMDRSSNASKETVDEGDDTERDWERGAISYRHSQQTIKEQLTVRQWERGAPCSRVD